MAKVLFERARAMKRYVAAILALACLMGQTALVGRASADVCLTPAENCGAVCLMSPAPPVVAEWKVVILCCCKTYSGGACCTQAANCGDKHQVASAPLQAFPLPLPK